MNTNFRIPSANTTNFTVWIVTSAPHEGTTRATLENISVSDQGTKTLSAAVLKTYSKVGALPFSPVNFGVRKGEEVVLHGQIENGQITQLVR